MLCILPLTKVDFLRLLYCCSHPGFEFGILFVRILTTYTEVISMSICYLIYRKLSANSGRKKNRREDTCTWLYWWNRLFQYLSVVKKSLFKSVFFDHLNESGIYGYKTIFFTQKKNNVRRISKWVVLSVLVSPTPGIFILNYAEKEKRTLVK